jgi:hypothetical protein
VNSPAINDMFDFFDFDSSHNHDHGNGGGWDH